MVVTRSFSPILFFIASITAVVRRAFSPVALAAFSAVVSTASSTNARSGEAFTSP